MEEKTKNIYLQNRNYLHNEWLEDDNKAFIKQKYDELKQIMALRSRPELDALNNGAPFTLKLQEIFSYIFSFKLFPYKILLDLLQRLLPDLLYKLRPNLYITYVRT